MNEEMESGFIVIRPWMVDLKLSGNELIIFAVVNGFSMDKASSFRGGLAYLCKITGISRRTAINCLNSLVDRGLIRKSDIFDREKNVVFSSYSVDYTECKKCTSENSALVQDFPKGSENSALGVVKNFPGGSENSAPKKKLRSKEKVKREVNTTFNARSALIELGCDADVADDFLSLRKRKRANFTKTALKGFLRETKKAGVTLNDALAMCCKRGWTGFEADWIDRKTPANETWGEFFARTNGEKNGTIDITPNDTVLLG